MTNFKSLFHKYLIHLSCLIFILSLFHIISPLAHAGGGAEGFIKDKGVGKNGIKVTFYAIPKDADSDLAESARTGFTTTKNHPVTGEPGYFSFGELQYSKEDDNWYYNNGPIPCKSFYYISFDDPSASISFTSQSPDVVIADTAKTNNTVRSATNVLGATPPPNIPPGCKLVTRTLPGEVIDNVVVGKVQYDIECGPPASEPPVAKCEGKCDWTKPDNGCPAAAGAEGGCYCVRQDDDNANTEGKCQPCPPGTTFNSTTNKCEPPGACNVGCVENKDCNSEPQKQAGCTVCRADTTGNKTCQPPVACNDSCRVDRPEDCQGATAKEGGTCSVCVPNQTGSNIGTCQAPPKLNCKCDSMEVSPIFIGSPINVTAYYKFYNGDLSGVKLPKMKFALYECTNQNSCNKKLEESEVTPQLVETSQSQVRYKGTWKFTPKEKLKVNTNYKIYLVSTPRRTPSSCSESTQASNYEQIMSLADSLIPTAHAQEETTSNTDTNPLQQVISWFSGLFGDNSTPIQNSENTADTDTTKEIQLTTLSPATVTNKGCYDYRFIIKQ